MNNIKGLKETVKNTGKIFAPIKPPKETELKTKISTITPRKK